MKTYTLEEAEKTTVSALIHAVTEDEPVVVVDGEKQYLVTSYQPLPPDYLDQYTDEEMEFFNKLGEESARCSVLAVQQMIEEESRHE